MAFYSRLLGVPWVYERLRIALLGGGPAGDVFGWLGDTREDILIDIGCGTGMAMDRLGAVAEYHGFDTDARALQRFRRRALPENVHLYNAAVTQADLDRIQPTKAIMMGLLHHLADAKAAGLLSMLARCPTVRSAITLDPVLIDGKPLNNLLCRLDRGSHVRTRPQYEALIQAAGFEAVRAEVLPSGNGAAFYFCTLLSRNQE
ncbi:MAG: class I SAM-dependent methyltransferase [Candidatus Hydrogenedentes bacterium]|nr:class I SAM-dependent methyltransferase [Candidatus Hydrogenedentota bacterium]